MLAAGGDSQVLLGYEAPKTGRVETWAVSSDSAQERCEAGHESYSSLGAIARAV